MHALSNRHWFSYSLFSGLDRAIRSPTRILVLNGKNPPLRPGVEVVWGCYFAVGDGLARVFVTPRPRCSSTSGQATGHGNAPTPMRSRRPRPSRIHAHAKVSSGPFACARRVKPIPCRTENLRHYKASFSPGGTRAAGSSSVSNLTKIYASSLLRLKSVHLDIQRGEIFASPGPERCRQNDAQWRRSRCGTINPTKYRPGRRA